MLVTETFHGYIESTQDVLLIFEGCRRGLLPRICRRLQERERKMIRSGSIFVFDERESGIKRWTDGRVWSPSRILGNFLIYRELDKKAGEKKSAPMNSTNTTDRRSFSIDSSVDRSKERQLVGSLSDSYRFKEDGLIKKTMSIIVNGVAQHLISYYDPQDVIQKKLREPSTVPELASLEISPELLVKQNFRIPPLVEPTFDQNDHHLGSITPPEASTSTGYNSNRAMHPLRSMSVGSIRHEQQQQLMYHPYQQPQQQTQQRPQSPSTNNYQHPLSIPNLYGNNNNSTNNTTGFHTANMPSPSSLTSSPSTPMLSPSRYHQQQHQQQQQHQRHYSTSSVSSTSLPRFDPRNYSDSMRQGSTSSSSLGQIMTSEQSERFASPNLGQLLNPIHPLNNTNSNNDSPSAPTAAATVAAVAAANAAASNNDILQSMGIHQHYDYNSSTLRNSISGASSNGATGSNHQQHHQHHDGSNAEVKLELDAHHNSGSNSGDNHSNNGNHGGGAEGGGGGGGGVDYMYYQRPLANHQQHLHNNFMFQQQDVYTDVHDQNDLMLK
ncbi:Gti1/Pac2 family-domain-containing protein [Mucor lusitanicus]|uniref:Gti1/Pac2 family-domain-containing protein n=4 Tax=Mucor circinelloides f. lusitanicus TaxID=29924 RepID=A0A8H4BHY9_MUCCL|nr:Gti1/Pac2 family-domain-containing protein [Mucor lusitanicus]